MLFSDIPLMGLGSLPHLQVALKLSQALPAAESPDPRGLRERALHLLAATGLRIPRGDLEDTICIYMYNYCYGFQY